MDAVEREVLKRIKHFARICRGEYSARSFAYHIADDAIRQAENKQPGIPVVGRVDESGRVTFFKD